MTEPAEWISSESAWEAIKPRLKQDSVALETTLDQTPESLKRRPDDTYARGVRLLLEAGDLRRFTQGLDPAKSTARRMTKLDVELILAMAHGCPQAPLP